MASSSSYENHGFSSEGKEGALSTPVAAIVKIKTKWTCCQITFLVLGSLSALMGLAMLVGGYQAMFDAILHSQLQVSPGSRAYDIWRLTPVPLFLRVYFFNITNPDEFQSGGKPILQEVGPYSYREYHEKQNLTFHPNNTVTYYQQRWWFWDQENSGDNHPDDVIITLNTVPVSAAWSVHDQKPTNILLSGLNKVMVAVDEPFTVTATVGETLFDGYSDNLLDAIWGFADDSNIGSIISGMLPPGLTDYDKFGWFYKRNLSLTYDGLFSMFTGEDTLDNLGKIDMWNRRRETDFFSPPCNNVSGSAGEMWPPNLEEDFIDFYSSDLCMSMTLFYKEETKDENGIPGSRYWGTNDTFNSSVVTGEEGCYCVDGTCAPMGLLNAESCRMGAPAFISFPHFLHADPLLLEGVEGLNPDPEKHAFYMDIIPELGTPMSVAARMQINMHVIPYPGRFGIPSGKIEILKDVKEVYLPMMWFEEIAAMPPDMVGQLKALLFIMNTPTMTIIWSLMLALGLLAILVVLLLHWRDSKRNRIV